MIADKEFLTPTMARVYADQGHLDQAAKIYRHLLEHAPDRREYLTALDEIEKKRLEDRQQADRTLVGMISTWLDLELGRVYIQRLKALRQENRTK